MDAQANSPENLEPGALGPGALAAGRLLFARECTFLTGAARDDQLPELGLPEVAFAGRSNVGKSSLLNALTGRKTLARTSRTPGRTQQINFFDLDGRLVLVDLPGYGYARAAKTDIKAWSDLTRRYLKARPQLRRICLLIDARHGLKASDRDIMADLDEAAASYQIVFTKADKIKPEARTELARRTAEALAKHPAAYPECATTSAVKGLGIENLRASLAMLAVPATQR
jgi:GTP-binding protein